MSEEQKAKLSTDAYKGVRDFYPEDTFIQHYMFGIMRKTAESFGYVEYDASILEPAELYKAKSGEEIINEQTYTFTDRGDREVTLRPEMTPTVARMVAARKRELAFPLRWYSIPNLFRYERPQKGRLREHWQFNVDIFGVESIAAETEAISLSAKLLKNFGADIADFEIRISSRKILNDIYASYKLTDDESHRVSKLIDKRSKISREDFASELSSVLGDRTNEFISLLDSNGENDLIRESEGHKDVSAVIASLNSQGITNARFDIEIMRGFDYYTGIIFEIFDMNPDNRRSMFGGGRYDDLLALFGNDKVPAVGFGMGDVTLRDFLATRNLLPAYKPSAEAYVCVADETSLEHATKLADELRSAGINTALDLSGKKLGDQLKKAEKDSIPYAIIVGENEIQSGKYKLKQLSTRDENEFIIDDIIAKLKSQSGK